MPLKNVTNTPTNKLTIGVSGDYEINYLVIASLSVAVATTVAVRNNGTNITSMVLTSSLSIGSVSTFEGSAIVTLTAGNVIDLAISATLAATVTLGSGVNAALSVKKLN